MRSIHELTGRFAEVTKTDRPMQAARDLLNELATDTNGVAEQLNYMTGTGGNALQAFYRTPNLSLLKVSFPVGRRTPPHNHGTWAAILLLSGREQNTLYRRDGNGQLSYSGKKLLEPGSVLTMPADIVHVAECVDQEPAIGLHVYGANVLGVERQMWDPDTLQEQTLDWDLYEGLAQRASAANAAPLT